MMKKKTKWETREVNATEMKTEHVIQVKLIFNRK